MYVMHNVITALVTEAEQNGGISRMKSDTNKFFAGLTHRLMILKTLKE
uniref:Uncharacterized protein n=1 Tax=Anguilla anguilla TaxID=7936 RepID=A0A0E9R0R5_ANGAN